MYVFKLYAKLKKNDKHEEWEDVPCIYAKTGPVQEKYQQAKFIGELDLHKTRIMNYLSEVNIVYRKRYTYKFTISSLLLKIEVFVLYKNSKF